MKERQLSEPGALRALGHPLRQLVLTELGRGPQPVPALASALSVSRHRLYHHMRVLEKHGFIVPVSSRVVSGITETTYGLSATSFVLPAALLGTDEVVEQVFGISARALLKAHELGWIPARPFLARGGTLLLNEGEAATLRGRLLALLEAAAAGPAAPDALPYRISAALIPDE